MSVLLSLVLFSACSSDDDDKVDDDKVDNGKVKEWKESKEPRGRITNMTGYILYDNGLHAWHFVSYWPYSPDITHDYYPTELGSEFRVDGLLVTLSGNIFWNEGEKWGIIEITQIEKCSSDKEIMDRKGFFSMKTEDCYSGYVSNAKDDDDVIIAAVKDEVKDKDWIKVNITEAPNPNGRSTFSPDPGEGSAVYFLKSDLQNPDIREGDIVDFKIISYKLLEMGHSATDVICFNFYCNVKPCK